MSVFHKLKRKIEKRDNQHQTTSLSTFNLLKKESGSNTFLLSDEQVKMTQKKSWAIACDIINVCEQHDIPYIMDGGSCLGAVRHGGFIPWDDDIDIAIARADYDRFFDTFEKEYGSKYWIHLPVKTNGYCLPHAQIRLKGTDFRGRDDFSPAENGIPVDVFVIENAFDNPIARLLQGAVCDFAHLVLSCRKFSVHSKYYLWFVEGSDAALAGVKRKIMLGKLLRFIPLGSAIRFANWSARICKNDESKWISVPSGWEHFFGGLNKREVIFPTTMALFEGRVVAIPGDYNHYMIHLYGEDYMKEPPVEKRDGHVLASFDLDSTQKASSSDVDC